MSIVVSMIIASLKKTLTIPNYLNEAGIEAGINFSQVLAESLKEKLEA